MDPYKHGQGLPQMGSQEVTGWRTERDASLEEADKKAMREGETYAESTGGDEGSKQGDEIQLPRYKSPGLDKDTDSNVVTEKQTDARAQEAPQPQRSDSLLTNRTPSGPPTEPPSSDFRRFVAESHLDPRAREDGQLQVSPGEENGPASHEATAKRPAASPPTGGSQAKLQRRTPLVSGISDGRLDSGPTNSRIARPDRSLDYMSFNSSPRETQSQANGQLPQTTPARQASAPRPVRRLVDVPHETHDIYRREVPPQLSDQHSPRQALYRSSSQNPQVPLVSEGRPGYQHSQILPGNDSRLGQNYQNPQTPPVSDTQPGHSLQYPLGQAPPQPNYQYYQALPVSDTRSRHNPQYPPGQALTQPNYQHHQALPISDTLPMHNPQYSSGQAIIQPNYQHHQALPVNDTRPGYSHQHPQSPAPPVSDTRPGNYSQHHLEQAFPQFSNRQPQVRPVSETWSRDSHQDPQPPPVPSSHSDHGLSAAKQPQEPQPDSSQDLASFAYIPEPNSPNIQIRHEVNPGTICPSQLDMLVIRMAPLESIPPPPPSRRNPSRPPRAYTPTEFPQPSGPIPAHIPPALADLIQHPARAMVRRAQLTDDQVSNQTDAQMRRAQLENCQVPCKTIEPKIS